MPQPINSLSTPNPLLQPLIEGTDVENVGLELDPIVTNNKDKYRDKFLTSTQTTPLKSSSFTEHGIYMDTSKVNLDNYSPEELNNLLWWLQKGVRDAKEDLVTMGRRWDNAPFFDKYPFGWVDYLVAKGYVENKILELEAFIPTVENKIRQMQPPVKLALAGQYELSDEALQKISELKSQKVDLVNQLNQLKSELDTASWYQVPLIYGQIAIKGIEIFNINNAISMWEKGGPTVRPT